MRLLDNEWKGRAAISVRASARAMVVVAVALTFGVPSVSVAQPKEVRRIGYLALDSAELHAPYAAAFRNGLRENGYIEGQNVAIVWRFAGYNPATLTDLASELVSLKVETIVADGTQAALAAKRATRAIPIVVPTSGDLVGAGLVASLARPGGNLTGLTLMSPGLIGKRLALLKEMAPRVQRVAMLVNPDNPSCALQLQEAQTAAPSIGLGVHATSIRQGDDIDRVIPPLIGRADAILLCDDVLMDAHRTQIGTLAIRNRLPSICGTRYLKTRSA